MTRETHNEDAILEVPGQRIEVEIPRLGEAANCNFGGGSDVNMCGWSNLNMSAFNWLSSSGLDSYWIGGPQIDENEKSKQGIGQNINKSFKAFIHLYIIT